ncbi:ribosome maturation factor RimP [Candidatus Odyssella acanthamoebae]|uniref:Ribosome maturation factor RimP n=1 Tax=Candidatus Odyssella acanthamoebae TaxID=91604 RepID=A0A077AVM7_9PROT|nr:ribosome maturation factor RimP [Candidatus Paracaedibacter acanthamoebae]AIK97207.1 hypothetical protein ID47_11405 [Candidatus Paracaedibacter acanthamoebae]
MDVLKKVEEILEPSLTHMGYEIVRIQMSGLKRKTLQIMIDRLDGTGIKLEDCEQVSRYTSVLLDQHDPISSAYMLEVSSPGIARPLVKLRDFQRFIGHEVMIKTHMLIGNRKTFPGKLESANESEVVLTIKNSANEFEKVSIPFSDMKSAKLHIPFN